MKKSTKKTLVILSIIAIAILLFLLFRYEQTKGIGKNFMEVRMYDKDGNLIGTAPTLSIVNSISGVVYIDISINTKNTGLETLACGISSTSISDGAGNPIGTPTANPFYTALSSVILETRNILPGQTGGWTSAKFPVAQFEPYTQPTRFSAGVGCQYQYGGNTFTIGPELGNVDLIIEYEGAGSPRYTVTLDYGGVGSEWCGDGICQTPTECPAISGCIRPCLADCTVPDYVEFKTSDLSYVSGSTIAYATCGQDLLVYNYVSPGTSSGQCNQLTECNGGGGVGAAVIKLSSVPGLEAGWQLYVSSYDNKYSCICINNYPTSGVFTTKNYYSDGVTTISGISSNPQKESPICN